MSATLPERTLDQWVAAYLVQRSRYIEIWAPTQNSVPDFDLGGRAGKLFFLELKGAHEDRLGNDHWTNIDIEQLWIYMHDPDLRQGAYYVLPDPPYAVGDALPGGPTVPLPPARLARTAKNPWGWPPFCRWCVAAKPVDLWNWLSSLRNPPLPNPAGAALPASAPKERGYSCRELQSLNPAGPVIGQSLRRGVDSILQCPGGIRVKTRARLRALIERLREVPSLFGGHTVVAFIAAEHLPNWDDQR